MKLLIPYVVLSTAGLVLLKRASTTSFASQLSWQSILRLAADWKFVVGFMCYAASFGIWMVILSKRELSYVFPFATGLGYISVLAVSCLFLGEQLSLSRILGVLFIGIGLVFISRG